MIPRTPIELEPAFEDPARVHALFDALAPYSMLQARGQVMGSHLEQAAITGAPISDAMVAAAATDAARSLRLTPTFRGYWASVEHCPPEVEWILHDDRFHAAARRLHGGAVRVVPTEIYAHIIAPHRQGPPGSHVDLPSFRGIGRRDLPVWLLVTMRRSGLFEAWRVSVATAVSWFYRGPGGSFTYWPTGPEGESRTTQPPFDNTGVVGENDSMFHRGDPVGDGRLEAPAQLSLESTLAPSPEGPQRWQVRNGDEPIADYAREEVRFALSWSAKVFADEEALRCEQEHRDDLDLGRVLEIFRTDLARRALPADLPDDPLHDPAWVALLGRTYRMVPRHDPLAARGPEVPFRLL